MCRRRRSHGRQLEIKADPWVQYSARSPGNARIAKPHFKTAVDINLAPVARKSHPRLAVSRTVEVPLVAVTTE